MGGLRGWLRRLERAQEEDAALVVRQLDGTAKFFHMGDLKEAFLTNDRILAGENVPEHELTQAIMAGPDESLKASFFSRMPAPDVVEDLSEPGPEA